MDNAELEKYSQNIIKENRTLFNMVKQISNDLLNNPNIQDIDRYIKHLDKLTGIYGNINLAYKQARCYKKNQEAQCYNQLKLSADVNNEKFVSAVAEKEASLYVAPLRTARDILEGYVEVVIKAMETCRSHIYEYKRDVKYDG